MRDARVYDWVRAFARAVGSTTSPCKGQQCGAVICTPSAPPAAAAVYQRPQLELSSATVTASASDTAVPTVGFNMNEPAEELDDFTLDGDSYHGGGNLNERSVPTWR